MTWSVGALAGGLHALTGPDHLAVLLPSCIGKPWSEAYKGGASWGLGHGVGASMFGVLAFTFREWLNVEAASKFLEPAVGVALLVIGFQGLGLRGCHPLSLRRTEMKDVKMMLIEGGERIGEGENENLDNTADDSSRGCRRYGPGGLA
ncbi:unnamed protein product [Discosporangium mesarthrocarpum]